jgi:hypothetical protein
MLFAALLAGDRLQLTKRREKIRRDKTDFIEQLLKVNGRNSG